VEIDLALGLLIAAVGANGLLCGMSLDQSIMQLPARRRIGVLAYSNYSQAGDLGNGIALYAITGVGTALLSAVAAIAMLVDGPNGGQSAAAAALLAATVVHMAITRRAAPTNMSQRRHASDEPALFALFDRFARLQNVRLVFNLAALGGAVGALSTTVQAA
jgi:hypothetical protein